MEANGAETAGLIGEGREAPEPGAIRRLHRKLSRGLAQYVATRRIRAKNREPLVSFTFDDVPDTALIHGAPVLEGQGARGTFYIAGGLCGRTEPDRQLISSPGCIELHRRGHEIGCHTFSHPDLQTLDAAALSMEIASNRAFFRELVPDLVLESFAYPYGRSSFARKLQVQACFRSCRGNRAGVNGGMVDLGMLRAMAIDYATDRDRVARAIDGAVGCNGWLIFFTHDVAPRPTWIGCTPQFLDAAIAYARGRGCEIVTVREGLRRIGALPTREGSESEAWHDGR